MIYHVATSQDWKKYYDDLVYAPAAFEREGFIHLCQMDQLPGVLERYYKSNTNIILLHVNEAKLISPLKHEPSTNGELFPHLYGKLNKEAIEKIDWSREDFLR
jgi:uncharacterized protein (DUF952 family)